MKEQLDGTNEQLLFYATPVGQWKVGLCVW